MVNTYAIVTAEADPFMAEIHNIKTRIPVILTPENEHDWLAGKEVKDFSKPVVGFKSSGDLTMHFINLTDFWVKSSMSIQTVFWRGDLDEIHCHYLENLKVSIH